MTSTAIRALTPKSLTSLYLSIDFVLHLLYNRIMEAKICERCGTLFEKSKNSSWSIWDKARYCSRKCSNMVTAQARRKPPEHFKEYIHKYVRDNLEHRSAIHKAWIEKHPEKNSEYDRRKREKDPDAIRARSLIRNRVYRGKMPKATSLLCSVCNQPASEYHHPLGYIPPNNVIVQPLCHSCHEKAHDTLKICL